MQITNPMRKTLFAIMCVLIGLIENVAEFFIFYPDFSDWPSTGGLAAIIVLAGRCFLGTTFWSLLGIATFLSVIFIQEDNFKLKALLIIFVSTGLTVIGAILEIRPILNGLVSAIIYSILVIIIGMMLSDKFNMTEENNETA
jgi:hypothetical protein